jgi:hypothetical protein
MAKKKDAALQYALSGDEDNAEACLYNILMQPNEDIRATIEKGLPGLVTIIEPDLQDLLASSLVKRILRCGNPEKRKAGATSGASVFACAHPEALNSSKTVGLIRAALGASGKEASGGKLGAALLLGALADEASMGAIEQGNEGLRSSLKAAVLDESGKGGSILQELLTQISKGSKNAKEIAVGAVSSIFAHVLDREQVEVWLAQIMELCSPAEKWQTKEVALQCIALIGKKAKSGRDKSGSDLGEWAPSVGIDPDPYIH